MKTFREKYDFWTDRKVGKYIYRYGSFEIKRCRADDPARHFQPWEEYDRPRDCIRAWQKLCDQAAENVDATFAGVTAGASRSTAKETAR